MLLTINQFLGSFSVPDSRNTNSPFFWIQPVTDGGGLGGVPQSITDVRPFSVRVYLSLVEGSSFCSLKTRQTNALVHLLLRWNYGENCCWLPSSPPSAVSTTWPAPRCPRRRPITKNSSVLLPGWTSRILTPFQGLLHFFQQQREQTLVTCY